MKGKYPVFTLVVLCPSAKVTGTNLAHSVSPNRSRADDVSGHWFKLSKIRGPQDGERFAFLGMGWPANFLFLCGTRDGSVWVSRSLLYCLVLAGSQEPSSCQHVWATFLSESGCSFVLHPALLLSNPRAWAEQISNDLPCNWMIYIPAMYTQVLELCLIPVLPSITNGAEIRAQNQKKNKFCAPRQWLCNRPAIYDSNLGPKAVSLPSCLPTPCAHAHTTLAHILLTTFGQHSTQDLLSLFHQFSRI